MGFLELHLSHLPGTVTLVVVDEAELREPITSNMRVLPLLLVATYVEGLTLAPLAAQTCSPSARRASAVMQFGFFNKKPEAEAPEPPPTPKKTGGGIGGLFGGMYARYPTHSMPNVCMRMLVLLDSARQPWPRLCASAFMYMQEPKGRKEV